MTGVWAAVIVLVLIGAGYGLHRFLKYAASRKWVYYGDHKAPGGQGMNLIGQIFSPEMVHVVEQSATERVEREVEEAGDTPFDELTDEPADTG